MFETSESFACCAIIISIVRACGGCGAASPLAPFCKPKGPEPVTAAFFASSRCAASSLNCLYVLVFGTISARNSRLSIRETAVAGMISGNGYRGDGKHIPRSL